MFRDFSFDASARNPPLLDIRIDNDRSSRHVSPTSTAPPNDIAYISVTASPSTSMAVLQERIRNYHISNTASSSPSTALPTSYYSCFRPSYAIDEGIVSDMYELNSEPVSEAPSRPISGNWSTPLQYSELASDPLTSRRLQRQYASRLQCTEAHASRISLLLETMIATGDQCTLSRVCSQKTNETSVTSSDAGDDLEVDDGIELGSPPGDTDVSPALRYRRSGEMRRDVACVSKSVRLRKRDGAARKQRRSRA